MPVFLSGLVAETMMRPEVSAQSIVAKFRPGRTSSLPADWHEHAHHFEGTRLVRLPVSEGSGPLLALEVPGVRNGSRG